MAFTPLKLKALHHGRSLSLPTKSDPATSQIEENLSKLKAAGATSSLSSFNDRMSNLKNLYHGLDDSLQIITQKKWADQVLDRHITLLDACSEAKDIFSHIKHGVQDLLSSIRRKDASGIKCYLSQRKNSRKMIQKSLKDLTSLRSKHIQSSYDTCLFKEAESSTIVILESMLSYAMGSSTQMRQGSWSLVSKLVKSRSNHVEETDINEFVKVDALLKMNQEDDTQVKGIICHLNTMASQIQYLEEELECLFRQFIKIRVSLLNSLHY